MHQSIDNVFWSTFFGYVSIGCWIVVFFPQIYENWRRKSSDSLSLHFVLIWILGDLFNLLGVVLQDLLFTMLLVAVYYTLSDAVLLWQTLYYRHRISDEATREESIQIGDRLDEQAPLLVASSHLVTVETNSAREQFYGIDRHSSASVQEDRLVAGSSHASIAKKVMYIAMPIVLINMAWILDMNSSESTTVLAWSNQLASQSRSSHDKLKVLPQLLGYISAFLYIGARIPQIVLNYRNKCCEGLSIMMFFFCVAGNLTYCASILLYSTKFEYIMLNFPWLLGSGGTLFFDFVIFWQFYAYKGNSAVASAPHVSAEHTPIV